MISENIRKLRKEVPDTVAIVCVTKGRTIDQIVEVIAAGIRDIGENKAQEALTKYRGIQHTAYGTQPIRWHMVGHLQTNKAKDAVRIFDLIHSVDSLHLAEEIDRQAAKINKVQDILIQVNTSGEESKFGLRPESLIEAFLIIKALKNVSIKGLMTIAPLVDNPEKARLYFRRLKELRDKIYELRVTSYESLALSMGMTDDYKTAIEEGANMIRLGRAIFEG